MKAFINKLIDLIKNFYQTIKIKFINILNKNKEMKRIRDVWQGNLPPTDHNVLWLDTSNNTPVLKAYLGSSWRAVGNIDLNLPIDSISICIATEDEGGNPITPTISKVDAFKIVSAFTEGKAVTLKVFNNTYDAYPSNIGTVDINHVPIGPSATTDGIGKDEYHLNWLSHGSDRFFFNCVSFAIPVDSPVEDNLVLTQTYQMIS